MTMETSANFDLRVTDNSKEEAFRACVDPVEHDRQISMIGERLEREIANLFAIKDLSFDQAIQTAQGKELAAVLGPNVILSQRDQFFAEGISDRFTVNYGDLIYWTRDRDNALGVVSASISDGGAPMASNPLVTEKGYRTPIQVIPNRLVMSFEYDNPRLAEAQASSRQRAIDFARYRIRKAYQDVILAAWVGGKTTTFAAAVKYDLPTGRVHPTTNIIDASSGGKLSLDKVREYSDYFDTLGYVGKKVLYVSPIRFNDIKTWVSTSAATDAGNFLAGQILQNSLDTIQIFDVFIVKNNVIPDATGYGFVDRDGMGNRALNIFQFGSIQTLPSVSLNATRSKFDVVLPGLAGVNVNPVQCAFVKFA